jgi:peptidoglycan/LPS O-acetylase OafA/YrhL
MHVVGAEAIYSGQSGMHSLSENVHTTLTAPILVGNSLFLQTISLPGMRGAQVSTFGSNGPLWSLAFEFWYYMAFPLLVLLLVKSGSNRSANGDPRARVSRWLLRAACIVGLVVWVWFVGTEIALMAIPWLVGVLIRYLPPFPARRPWARYLAIGASLALVGGGLVLGKIHGSLTMDLALGFVVGLLIWVTLQCATAPLPKSYIWLAQRSARSSYTLYLIHMPVLILLKATLDLPRAFPSWHSMLVNAGILAVILLYAQLVYELFEKNTSQVRNWLKPYVMSQRAA